MSPDAMSPDVMPPGQMVRTTSVDDLLAGATSRTPLKTADSKSGATFERVVLRGEPHVVKYLHVDDDWIMRMTGDVRCRPVLLWQSGMLARMPSCVDHAVVGAAAGLGRNGWGGALLMRDVTDLLVPDDGERLPLERHLGFLDAMAAMTAQFLGWSDTIGLAPVANRYTYFLPRSVAAEVALGHGDAVPRIALEGWGRFPAVAPRAAAAVADLLADPWPLVDALTATPWSFLHGDWKLGNLGSHPDGRTILLDWAVSGLGPPCHDLAWYLALNRERLPQGKEDTIAAFAAALRRHGVDTNGWFDRQMALCLLGAFVQFGWEKALGDEGELAWWSDRAIEGVAGL